LGTDVLNLCAKSLKSWFDLRMNVGSVRSLRLLI
jgi:hypothetical protein